MSGWQRLEGIAAPLAEADVDTDVIFPARFLLLLDKAGLGRHAFHERRYLPDGTPRPEFVLNRPPWDAARILVTGANFGSGSSREHAVWALADFGIRCIAAPSFGEIFYANCLRNGILALRLEGDEHARVLAAAEQGRAVAIDLAAQTLQCDEAPIPFKLDPHRRRALMEGLDEIGLLLADDLADILRFEKTRHGLAPWLIDDPAEAPG